MRTSGEETKGRIEEAAIRVFVRSGVAGASMRDISREARVSLGAIYNHYPSKEELAWTLFSRGWAEMAAALREQAKGEDSLPAQLEAMVRHVFGHFDRDWEQVSYIFLSRHEHLRRVTASLPNPHLVFRAVIVDAMGRGEIPQQDADLATALVMGAIIQVIDTKILKRIKTRLSSLVEPVAAACFRLLGTPT